MNTAFKPMYEWETINWAKVQRYVFKLQKRIYQASERGQNLRIDRISIMCV
jgi:RNA-directed DNA polymerase